MILIAALMVLVLNEYASGEGWYKGVIKGLCGFTVLFWAATVSPGRTFVLCMMGLCAVAAAELYRIDERRSSAARTLKELDERAAERNARNARRGLLLETRSKKQEARYVPAEIGEDISKCA